MPDTNLAKATALMWDYDCGAIPVLTEAGELSGIITDRDICIALGTRDSRASELTVREIGAPCTLVCKTSDDVRSTVKAMRQAKVRRVPVVDDDGVLQGVVSIDSIVGAARQGSGKAGPVEGQIAGHLAA